MIHSTIWTYFASILIWSFFSIAFLPFLTIFLVYRFLLKRIVPFVNRKIDRIVPSSGQIFILKDTTAELTLFPCYGFEGRIEVEELQKVFQERIISRKDSEQKLTRPEFQQFLASITGYHFWQWDEKFDLKNHIKLLSNDATWNQKEKTTRDVLEIFEKNKTLRCWPKNRSPWELLVVHNFNDFPTYSHGSSSSYNGTLLILRIHHVMGDGTSFGDLFYDLLHDKKISEPLIPENAKQISSRKEQLRTIFLGPLNSFRFALKFIRGAKILTWNHRLMRRKEFNVSVGLTPIIPLAVVKRLQRTHSASFSAVVMTIASKAFLKLMAHAGYNDDEDAKELGWVSTRMAPHQLHPVGKLRNHLSVVISKVPLKLEDSETFKKSEESFAEGINCGFPDIVFYADNCVVGRLPRAFRPDGNVARLAGFSTACLAAGDLSFEGKNRLRTSFVVGLKQNDEMQPICISTICNDTFRLTLQVEEGIVPNQKVNGQVFADLCMKELEYLTGGENSV